jgi:hypothetical protein
MLPSSSTGSPGFGWGFSFALHPLAVIWTWRILVLRVSSASGLQNLLGAED